MLKLCKSISKTLITIVEEKDQTRKNNLRNMYKSLGSNPGEALQWPAKHAIKKENLPLSNLAAMKSV